MKPRTRLLENQNKAWSNAGQATITVPPDRWVGEALLYASFVYDTAAAGAVAQDGVLNGISLVEIVINGKVKRSWAPSRKWYTLPLDLPAAPEKVEATAVNAAGKAASFALPIYFRADQGNDDDLSCLLPAHQHSSVEIRITFGATGAFGTNQTIISGTVTCQLKEYDLSASEEVALYGVSGEAVIKRGSRLMEILEHEATHTVDAAYTNRGFEVDLPTGDVLTRSFLFATLNAVRSDALVSNYEVARVSPFDQEYFLESWASSQLRDKMEYGIVSPLEGNRYLTGFTVLDYVEFGSLDLKGDRKGAVKLRATVAAPVSTTNLRLLHERFNSVNY